VPVVSLVTVADVADELNWSAAQTTAYTAEVQHFIDAITPVIEGIVGPVSSTPYDEWHDGGYPILLLLHPPVLAITTITEAFGANTVRVLSNQPLDGVSAVDSYGYTADLESGEITRRISGRAAPFTPGRRNIHVVYTAGRSVTPENIRLGALELIRVNWQPQQGGNRPGYSTGAGVDGLEVEGAWRMGFFVPNRVMELLAPSRHSWGLA
jgi:hypothetical protein